VQHSRNKGQKGGLCIRQALLVLSGE